MMKNMNCYKKPLPLEQQETLNKLEEGNSATSTRNRMAGLEDAMRHFMAEGKTTLTIEDLQELYDKTMEEL